MDGLARTICWSCCPPNASPRFTVPYIRACLKGLRRQSSTATDRFRIRYRPLSLESGNCSSCPRSCRSKVADQNVSESAASVRRDRFDGSRVKKRRPEPPPIDSTKLVLHWTYFPDNPRSG